LGSNIGDRQGHLAAGRAALAELPGTRVVGVSSVEETQRLDGCDKPWYVNQRVALETSLTPHELLRKLQSIESRQGRVRRERWASRTLELEIVGHQTQSVQQA